MTLSHAHLLTLIHYDPETGSFTRRCQQGTQLAGAAAGNKGNHGYLQFQLAGEMRLAHRVAFFYMTGAWPTHTIDHINGDKNDNRWDNLRAATQSENSRNIRRTKRNRSGSRGVSWNARRRKWYVFIKYEGRQRYLGGFDDKAEATARYEDVARVAFGEFYPQ